jgi:hypothetical protein
MPEKLYDAFGITLERIKNQKPSVSSQAMNVLQWVFLAARPLSLEELIIIIIIFHSVCNLNGYDSRNITITFFPNLFQRLSIPKKA